MIALLQWTSHFLGIPTVACKHQAPYLRRLQLPTEHVFSCSHCIPTRALAEEPVSIIIHLYLHTTLYTLHQVYYGTVTSLYPVLVAAGSRYVSNPADTCVLQPCTFVASIRTSSYVPSMVTSSPVVGLNYRLDPLASTPWWTSAY